MRGPASDESGNRRPRRAPFRSETRAVVALAATVVLVLLMLWHARRVFLLAFAGILLAILLQTLASLLRRRLRLPYGLCLVVVIGLLATILGLTGWLVGSRISVQLAELFDLLPKSMAEIRAQTGEGTWARSLVDHLPPAREVFAKTDLVAEITGLASGAAGAIAGIVVILFVGLYGAAQPGIYIEGLLRLIPPARRGRAREILSRLGATLRWWLIGQLIAMTTIGALTALGLMLLGSPLPLALGLLAFLLQIVPNVGPILASIPALLLAATHGPIQLLHVLLLYSGIHAVESYLLMPLVQLRTVRLPPALHILGAILFSLAGGLLGVLVAAPMLITVIVLVQAIYVEDLLGDREPNAPTR